jgi:hypothetical protein
MNSLRAGRERAAIADEKAFGFSGGRLRRLRRTGLPPSPENRRRCGSF